MSIKLILSTITLSALLAGCGGGGGTGGDGSTDNQDTDNDGIQQSVDNCPTVSNNNQADLDGDGVGDACDTEDNRDTDGDNVEQHEDNCPLVSNNNQADLDGDGAGDACDTEDNRDTDGDGIEQHADNCPVDANPDQNDADNDGVGDACDTTAACASGIAIGSSSSTTAAVVESNDFISFEQNEAPSQWFTSKGSLAINDDRQKHGTRSLEWNWEGCAQLVVSDLPSQALVPNQVDGFFHGFFRLWIYNTAAVASEPLQIEFYNADDELQYHYSVNIDFTGWRAATVSYKTHMQGDKDTNELETMVIRAPSNGTGTLMFDYLDFSTDRILHVGGDHQIGAVADPSDTSHWENMLTYEGYTKTVAATTPTPAELAASDEARRRLFLALNGSAPNSSRVAQAISEYDSLNISINGGVISGTPFFGTENPAWGVNIDLVSRFLPVLVQDYRHNGSSDSLDKAINTLRYILDQGFAGGSNLETIHHVGYAFDGIADVLVLLKDEFEAAGIWNEVVEMMIWMGAVEQIWDPDTVSDLDYANTRLVQILGIILSIDDDSKRIQYLKGYAQAVGNWVSPKSRGGEGVKTDYSTFHHNTHYPGYGYPALNNLARAIYYISGATETAVAPAKLALFEKLVLSARLNHAERPVVLSLSGRNPFAHPHFRIALEHLAEASDTATKDALYGAYVRVYGSDSASSGYAAETSPTGFWQFNYRPMGVYRQDDWVANMKGFNQLLWGSEIYSSENRYGRYQSYGSLFINYNGQDDSGYRAAGWDWNVVPGATTKHLHIAELVASQGRQDETTESKFAAALRFGEKASASDYYLEDRLEGTVGVFGFDFQQQSITATHDETFRFKQSVFSFDGMMVALGSGIHSDDPNSNVIATNLFQRNTADAPQNTNLDGSEISATSHSSDISTSGDSAWLIDPYGTGYFIPQGNDVVKVVIGNYDSPGERDNGTVNSGNVAKAWLQHGQSPLANADYQYVIIPSSNAADMAALETTMNTAPPYSVLQQDQVAHVIELDIDGGAQREGYAIFASSSSISGRFVVGSDTPILAMASKTGNDLTLSVVNPDLDFADVDGHPRGDSQSARVVITLSGGWLKTTGPADATVINGGATSTVAIDTFDGNPVDLLLTAQ